MVYAPAVIIVLPGYRFTSDRMLDKGICFLGLLVPYSQSILLDVQMPVR